jgi:hypothetical protein
MHHFALLDGQRNKNRSVLPFGLIVSAIALVASYFFQGISNNVGDIYGAMPIVKESAFPGLYAKEDLIVSAGIRGPFHIYKMAGALYRLGLNVDIIWFCLLLLFLYLTFLALWKLSYGITESATAASLAVFFLATANPWRGSLNWSPVPMPFLVTSLFAMPLGFLAFSFFLRQRYLAALLTAAAVFNIHPSGIILLVVIGFYILVSVGSSPISTRLTWLVMGFVAALPNAVYTFLQLPRNFLAEDALVSSYFYDQFRIFGYHAFIEDHWREGYGWFFLHFAGAVFFMKYLDSRNRKMIGYSLLALSTVLLAYICNLYLFKSRTIILLLLFRVTFYIKPLLFTIVTYGSYRWFIEDTSVNVRTIAIRSAVVAGFLYALYASNPLLSELVLFLTYALFFYTSSSRTSALRAMAYVAAFLSVVELAVYAFSKFNRLTVYEQWSDSFIVVHIVSGILLLLLCIRNAVINPVSDRPVAVSEQGIAPAHGRALVVVVLLFLLLKTGRTVYAHTKSGADFGEVLSQRVYYSRPAMQIADLVNWARENTPKASLFAVPPVDTNHSIIFSQFRMSAERSIYVSLFDIYQLVYDVNVYKEGIDRLKKLGVTVVARHKFDDSAYHDLSSLTLQRLHEEDGVNYAVFYKSRIGANIRQLPFIYDNDRFVVVQLDALH